MNPLECVPGVVDEHREGQPPGSTDSGALAVPGRVEADDGEAGSIQCVQELLVEQGMGHRARQEEHRRRFWFAVPRRQRHGRPRRLDEHLAVGVGSLYLVQDSLCSRAHV